MDYKFILKKMKIDFFILIYYMYDNMLNTLEFINDLFNIKSPDIDDNTQITSKNHHIIFKIILVKHNFSEFYNKESFTPLEI